MSGRRSAGAHISVLRRSCARRSRSCSPGSCSTSAHGHSKPPTPGPSSGEPKLDTDETRNAGSVSGSAVVHRVQKLAKRSAFSMRRATSGGVTQRPQTAGSTPTGAGHPRRFPVGALPCLRPRSFTLCPPSRPVVRNREAHAEGGRPSYSVSRLPVPFPRGQQVGGGDLGGYGSKSHKPVPASMPPGGRWGRHRPFPTDRRTLADSFSPYQSVTRANGGNPHADAVLSTPLNVVRRKP